MEPGVAELSAEPVPVEEELLDPVRIDLDHRNATSHIQPPNTSLLCLLHLRHLRRRRRRRRRPHSKRHQLRAPSHESSGARVRWQSQP